MCREKRIVWGIFLFSFLLWFLDVALRYPFDYSSWLSRKEMYNLTGVLAVIPMGIIMILSLRPRCLERAFNGLDKMYYVHKWLGIISIIFVFLHYAVKLGKGFFRALHQFIGQAQVEGDKFLPLKSFRDSAETIGEVLVYLFAIMLILTLLHKLPYRFWKYIHKLITILFVGVVFHTLVLMPARYWGEPIGIVIIILSFMGIIAGIIAIFGLIGKHRQFESTIVDVEHQDDITLVTCSMSPKWHHKAGQYAFLRHQGTRESHPFTIASNDINNGQVRFAIKALGHYTNQIQTQWKIGDAVRVEGPYGRFFFDQAHGTSQIWIAGGVGITPFIAWLESLQGTKVLQPVTLYYCVKQEGECLVPIYLAQLAESCGVTLHIYCSDTDGFLKVHDLPLTTETDVFFCGPSGFAKSIEKAMKSKGISVSKHFHREYFDMR